MPETVFIPITQGIDNVLELIRDYIGDLTVREGYSIASDNPAVIGVAQAIARKLDPAAAPLAAPAKKYTRRKKETTPQE